MDGSVERLFSVEPWPHQRHGVEQTIDSLSNGVKSCCLTSPTGSGKSPVSYTHLTLPTN